MWRSGERRPFADEDKVLGNENILHIGGRWSWIYSLSLWKWLNRIKWDSTTLRPRYPLFYIVRFRRLLFFHVSLTILFILRHKGSCQRLQAVIGLAELVAKISRNLEKEGEERSFRVRSERPLFSPTNNLFWSRRWRFSLSFAVISPSSWLIYSVKNVSIYSRIRARVFSPFLLKRKARAETLFRSCLRSLLLSFLPSSLASSFLSLSISSSSFWTWWAWAIMLTFCMLDSFSTLVVTLPCLIELRS